MVAYAFDTQRGENRPSIHKITLDGGSLERKPEARISATWFVMGMKG